MESALERQTTFRASLHWRKKTAVYQRCAAPVGCIVQRGGRSSHGYTPAFALLLAWACLRLSHRRHRHLVRMSDDQDTMRSFPSTGHCRCCGVLLRAPQQSWFLVSLRQVPCSSPVLNPVTLCWAGGPRSCRQRVSTRPSAPSVARCAPPPATRLTRSTSWPRPGAARDRCTRRHRTRRTCPMTAARRCPAVAAVLLLYKSVDAV